MTVSPAQLDAHLKSLKGKYNYWDGIGGAQCMVIFASVNQFIGGPAYSAPGAKDLWNNPALNSGYTQISAAAVPQFGDQFVYGNTWGDGWGHVGTVVENVDAASFRGFGQNPGVAATTVLSKGGLLGYLRPRALAVEAPTPTPAPPAVFLVNRFVTNDVAYVRTAPASSAPAVAHLPTGLAKGAAVAVKGYVSGEDPYGTGDNAWYVTDGDFYLWANAAENSLAGLPQL